MISPAAAELYVNQLYGLAGEERRFIIAHELLARRPEAPHQGGLAGSVSVECRLRLRHKRVAG